ncbi:hypothetical protein PsYK624_139480 [Phanerochaete sordida]|uniref:Uncharacterized protein n=1 Tax=Phanerochaete sordida TaxID=48140 RepID=A0A9P3GLU3_9APHY|nr:hypothetical protein PsYK624_139480 [Phanerochaete sordida]
MRALSLLAAVCLALHASAAPMQFSKELPVPVLGPFTLGAIGPAAVPNPNLPSPQLPGGVPHTRRSNLNPASIRPRANSNLNPAGIHPRADSGFNPAGVHPRAIHSADFEASPNSTIAAVPEAAAAAPSKRDSGDASRASSPNVYRRAERKQEYHAHMRNEGEDKGKDKGKDKFDMSKFDGEGYDGTHVKGRSYERHTQVDKREPSEKKHHKTSAHDSEVLPNMARRADSDREHKHHQKPGTHGSAALEQLARRAVDRAEKAKAAHRKTAAPAPNTPTTHKQDRPQDRAKQENVAAPGPAGAASGAATGLKSIGALPHALSGATSAAPVTLPATPLTSADNSAAEAAAAQAAAEEAAAPHPVEEKAGAQENADAYPHVDGYKPTEAAPPVPVPGADADAGAAPTANVKRHSLVMDTDPLVPPQDMTGKDPSMGLLNLDSNRPAEDVPAKKAVDKAKVPAAPTGDLPPPPPAPAPPAPPPAQEQKGPDYPAYAAPA